MAIRKERNRTLRELAAAKNLRFRQGMVGRMLSAITLNDPGAALSDNYLKVGLTQSHQANRLVNVVVTRLTDDGVGGHIL
jgi:tRNA A37 methylthiotransferase MiaB